AHGTFQRTMAESHLAYLRTAETVLAGLLGAATGETPAGPITAPVPERPAPPMPVPEPPALTTPVPEPPAPPQPAPPPNGPDIEALLLSVVAERTGYPVEILTMDMALDTDLGIDSIKKVEILSAVRDRVGDVPSGELSTLAALRTLREIAERFAANGT